MERSCDACGKPYEARTARSRFCKTNCRVAYSRGSRPPSELPAPVLQPRRPQVRPVLALELADLGVGQSYEGMVALGLAMQLDNGTITGTAYVSLSKELDRRVEGLRLRAERPDDPAKAVKDRLVEKRLRLA